MSIITPMHWFGLSTLIFSIGLYGLLTRRNAIGILMSIELMLNSSALNFIIFNRFIAPESIDGSIMVLFIIAIAAAEAVMAMAIFMSLFRIQKTLDISVADKLNN